MRNRLDLNWSLYLFKVHLRLLYPVKWNHGLKNIQNLATVKVIDIFSDLPDSIGKIHKFYKNCLACGLIFCQQNSKLANCSFCSYSFDSSIPVTKLSSIGALEKSINLQNRLLAADNDDAVKADIRDEYNDASSGSFLQTKFCPASEIIARKREIDIFKAKLAQQQEEKSTYDLSKMLNFQ